MTNALVLDPQIAWTIELDQAVALRVFASGRARSLYPLKRLGRVVCGRRARWDTEALLACLDAGVPVLFTDHRGDGLGWCFGLRRREATLEQLLRTGLAHADWAPWFSRWQEATERREIIACLRELELPCGDLRPSDARARLCNWHRLRVGFGVGPCLHALEQVTAGTAAQVLAGEVGDATLLGFAREGLHLPVALTRLLQWRLHTLLARSALPLKHNGAGTIQLSEMRIWALRMIEGPGAPMHRAAAQLLMDLEQALREWVL